MYLSGGKGADTFDGDAPTVTDPFASANFDRFQDAVVASKPVADGASHFTAVTSGFDRLRPTLTGLAAATEAIDAGVMKTATTVVESAAWLPASGRLLSAPGCFRRLP